METIREGRLGAYRVSKDVWLSVIAPHLSVPDRVHLGLCNKWLHDVFCVRDERVQNWKRWFVLTCFNAAFEAAYVGDMEYLKKSLAKSKKDKDESKHRTRGSMRMVVSDAFINKGNYQQILRSAALGGHIEIIVLLHRTFNTATRHCCIPEIKSANAARLQKWESKARESQLPYVPGYKSSKLNMNVFFRACRLGFIPLIKCIVETTTTTIEDEMMDQAIFHARSSNLDVYCYLSKRRWPNWTKESDQTLKKTNKKRKRK